MQVARPAAGGAHGQLTGDRRFAGRRERRRLLVPDVLPTQLAVAAQGVGEAVQGITGQAVDTPNPRRLQQRDHVVCNGATHRRNVPPAGSANADAVVSPKSRWAPRSLASVLRSYSQ